MMKRLNNIRNEILFQNPESQVIYRRVVGAVGWPWEPKPGYMVVLGERSSFNLGLKGRPIDVLAEREVGSIAAIHQGCLELRKLWACDTWLANLEQVEALRLFRRLNQGQPVNRSDQLVALGQPVTLQPAPYSQGDARLQTLFQMLALVQSPDRKLLNYGPDSKLPGYAMGLDQQELQQPAAKFPALSALGYAVAEILLREPWSAGTETRVVNNWDLYQTES